MAEGRLMCSGSSLFLKSRYGVGYHLTLVKGRSCDTGRLSELIKSTVPGSQLASDVSAELTFLLPFTSSQHFPTLLDTLETQRSSLGFSSFGLSLTTMEEVFMKVGTGSTQLTTSLMLSQEPSAAPASASDQGVGDEKAWGVASSLILAENDVVYETEGVIGNNIICMHDYNIIEVFCTWKHRHQTCPFFMSCFVCILLAGH
jgi:hypothetical protein